MWYTVQIPSPAVHLKHRLLHGFEYNIITMQIKQDRFNKLWLCTLCFFSHFKSYSDFEPHTGRQWSLTGPRCGKWFASFSPWCLCGALQVVDLKHQQRLHLHLLITLHLKLLYHTHFRAIILCLLVWLVTAVCFTFYLFHPSVRHKINDLSYFLNAVSLLGCS